MKAQLALTLLAALIATVVASASARAQDMPDLDGRAFLAMAGPESDLIVFSDGMLDSTACRAYGFTPGAVTVTVEGDALVFAATTQSAENGQMAWTGRVTGNHLEGSWLWTKEGQEPVTMAFAGEQSMGSLDGTQLTVELRDASGQGPSDQLVFLSGTFESVACREYGFAPTLYTATQEGAEIRFTAEAVSPTEGLMRWTGVINGDRIEGSAEWIKEGQDTVHYDYEGGRMASR